MIGGGLITYAWNVIRMWDPPPLFLEASTSHSVHTIPAESIEIFTLSMPIIALNFLHIAHKTQKNKKRQDCTHYLLFLNSQFYYNEGEHSTLSTWQANS